MPPDPGPLRAPARRSRPSALWCLGLFLGVLGTLPDALAGADIDAGMTVQDLDTQSAANGDDRERAVRLAREGEFDEAVGILRRLLEEDPRDLGVRGDLAAVLAWAGRDAEALETGARLPFVELDPVIAESVARSARNEGWPGLAADIYSQLIPRHPDRVETRIGLTMAYKEWGQLREALSEAEELRERFPGHAEARMARGHVFFAAQRWAEAALEFALARERDPDHPEAPRREVEALEALGAHGLARERVELRSGLFAVEERARVAAGHGARLVEWASATPTGPTPAERFRAADRALSRLDAALARLPEDEGGFQRVRLRFDRAVALRERHRMGEVRAEVEALESEGHELPPYVQRVAADAALYDGDVDEALERYRVALAGWPDHPETRIGLFYALVETRRFAEAKAFLEEALAGQPERRWIEGTDLSLTNPDRLSIVVAWHLGLAFSGDLPGAQEGLESHLARAPMNTALRQELATVYLWRGWPRRAMEEYRRLLTVDPEHVGARVGLVAAHRDLGERRHALAVLDTLWALAPESEHLRRETRATWVDGAWELSAQVGAGRSTGGELGTRDHTLTTRILSAPVAHHLRFTAASHRADAEYEAGTGVHDRVSAGIDVRSRGLHLRIEGSDHRQGESRIGVDGRVELRPGDRLSLRATGGSHSVDVPLQATLQGVRGWEAGAGFSWRSHERRYWMLDGGVLEMTDGNRRWSVYSGLEQSLAHGALHRLAVRPEFYGASHSRSDVPYFSPSRMGNANLSFLWEWTPWETRESSMTQRVVTTGGTVSQTGESLEPFAGGAVEHEWSLTRRLDVRYGMTFGLPVYDGTRERRTAGHAGFTWRMR
jgi:biofilm PGA synthesis protein PgaA